MQANGFAFCDIFVYFFKAGGDVLTTLIHKPPTIISRDINNTKTSMRSRVGTHRSQTRGPRYTYMKGRVLQEKHRPRDGTFETFSSGTHRSGTDCHIILCLTHFPCHLQYLLSPILLPHPYSAAWNLCKQKNV